MVQTIGLERSDIAPQAEQDLLDIALGTIATCVGALAYAEATWS